MVTRSRREHRVFSADVLQLLAAGSHVDGAATPPVLLLAATTLLLGLFAFSDGRKLPDGRSGRDTERRERGLAPQPRPLVPTVTVITVQLSFTTTTIVLGPSRTSRALTTCGFQSDRRLSPVLHAGLRSGGSSSSGGRTLGDGGPVFHSLTRGSIVLAWRPVRGHMHGITNLGSSASVLLPRLACTERLTSSTKNDS
jgi:hypothetical protein